MKQKRLVPPDQPLKYYSRFSFSLCCASSLGWYQKTRNYQDLLLVLILLLLVLIEISVHSNAKLVLLQDNSKNFLKNFNFFVHEDIIHIFVYHS